MCITMIVINTLVSNLVLHEFTNEHPMTNRYTLTDNALKLFAANLANT